jgi:hypothetical protein
VAVDGAFQASDAPADATLDPLAGDLGAEPLDQVEPGRRDRREMLVETQVLRGPRSRGQMLVGGVIVQHQVQIEVDERVFVDSAQEADELVMAMLFGAAASETVPSSTFSAANKVLVPWRL